MSAGNIPSSGRPPRIERAEIPNTKYCVTQRQGINSASAHGSNQRLSLLVSPASRHHFKACQESAKLLCNFQEGGCRRVRAEENQENQMDVVACGYFVAVVASPASICSAMRLILPPVKLAPVDCLLHRVAAMACRISFVSPRKLTTCLADSLSGAHIAMQQCTRQCRRAPEMSQPTHLMSRQCQNTIQTATNGRLTPKLCLNTEEFLGSVLCVAIGLRK